jgi:transcriptional regulator PpsR
MVAKNVAPDITLLLDLNGVIREATLGNSMPEERMDAWFGRRWVETVGDVGNEKVRRMIDDARASGVSGFRQLTQRFPSGLEIPMEYTTVLLGGRAGLLAIGKSLQAVAELQSRLISAQQAMERDYWKLRGVETRYRLLFQASSEAIVLLKASSLTIVEANPPALDALGLVVAKPHEANGREILPLIADDEREAFEAMLSRVREVGKAPGMVAHLGDKRAAWMLRASLMADDPEAVFMLQLATVGGHPLRNSHVDLFSLEDMIDRLPDGLVIVDHQGVIRRANRAFLEMVEGGVHGSVVGEPLGRWLWRPGADLTVLLANVRRHGAARLLNTMIHGELGTDTEVEISAAGDSDVEPLHFCLLVRDVGRRIGTPADDSNLRLALGAVAERVGKTPLRALVKETVGVVERYYVRSALDLAAGNRTMAAELLGLSRQSLYAKLDRYGLDGSTGSIPDSGG